MTPREVVARIITQSTGLLMRGTDPRLTHQNKAGESAVTDSPANSTNTNPSNGVTNNGKAD
ncbi:MAG: hypothetical protein DWI29_01880 [Planctomycetota bacterium]|nr:MAG: hypothetical protein DWI29_01880 [Planctomycetota bacterium]